MSLHDDALTVLNGLSTADEHRDRFLELLAAGPRSVYPTGAGPHLTASALVVDHTATRVLLCLHGRLGTWVQLGGHCEPEDDTLAGAALREVAEESGIVAATCSATPVHVDILPANCRFGPSRHYDVRYAVLAPPGAVERCSDESSALGWFTPDALPDPLGDSTVPVIAAALAWARHELE